MSYDSIYASKAHLDDAGVLHLSVKSFANNVRPFPTQEERKRGEFSSVAKLDPTNPEAVAQGVESLARIYDGGSFKEGSKDISGMVAYRLWSKRIRRVLPDLAIREPRPSCVSYGIDVSFAPLDGFPTLRVGDPLTPEVARALLRSGIHPAVTSTALPGAHGFLAFVMDGRIHVSKTRNTRRGWPAANCLIAEPIQGVIGEPGIFHSEDGCDMFVRVDPPNQNPLFLNLRGRAAPISSESPADFAKFTAQDAELAKIRTLRKFPDVKATVISETEMQFFLAEWALLGEARPLRELQAA